MKRISHKKDKEILLAFSPSNKKKGCGQNMQFSELRV
jgi:hypothetical protein